MYITIICKSRNYQIIIFYLLNYSSPLIPKLHGKMKQKLALLWSRIITKNRVFALSHFIATYRNLLLCRYRWLWSLFVSSQLKNRFVESKRLCQRIKHRYVVFISFWRIQNCYKEMDLSRFLFYRYIACNLHRVAMAVVTERCQVEKLSCKGSIP